MPMVGNLGIQIPDTVRHGFQEVDRQQRVLPDPCQQGAIVDFNKARIGVGANGGRTLFLL